MSVGGFNRRIVDKWPDKDSAEDIEACRHHGRCQVVPLAGSPNPTKISLITAFYHLEDPVAMAKVVSEVPFSHRV